MRKFVILGLLLAVLLVGCSSEDEEIVKIINGNDSPDTAPVAQNNTPADGGEEDDILNETNADETNTTNTTTDTDINASLNMTSDQTANNTVNETEDDTEEEYVRVKNLTVEFIDFSGNSVLIRTPERKSVLIDGASNSDGLKLVKYLINKGIRKIDYVLSSNAEVENAGGLPSIMFNFNNSQAYCSGLNYNGNYIAYKSYQNYANSYSYPPIAITKDKVFDVSDRIELQAFVPYEGRSATTPVNDTIVYRLDHHSTSFLFLGDCRNLCFESIKEEDIEADVLNVHTPVSQEIIDAVSPKIIVYDEITNSTPEPEGVKVYSKSEGTVFIMSDGKKYFISTLGKT